MKKRKEKYIRRGVYGFGAHKTETSFIINIV